MSAKKRAKKAVESQSEGAEPAAPPEPVEATEAAAPVEVAAEAEAPEDDPKPIKAKAARMKKILVAVDFSPASVIATKYALRLATAFDAQLLVLHVLHDPADAPGFYSAKKAGKKVYRNMEEAAAKMMADFVGSHVNKYKKAEARIVPGIPADETVRAAKAGKVDLVVVGTRGHGGLKRLMLGSVADRIIRSAPCPVLSVHGED